MKGSRFWNCRPYKPVLGDVGDIYICRIVPGKTQIQLFWLEAEGPYSIYYRKRNRGEYVLFKETTACECTITGLVPETDYEFYVQCGEKKSRIRTAFTADAVGTVVNYLHPKDKAYIFSGQYLCSPSLLQHPDGYLLASMDLYAYYHPQNLTLLFRSDDNGKTWYYVNELFPCFHGKLFLHKGDVYMLAEDTECGSVVISRSPDGGMSFPLPVILLRGSNGKSDGEGVHKNPQNLVVHDGRIWETLEWGTWENRGKKDYFYKAMVMSCSVDDDLMNPENWSFSEPVQYDPNWPGTVEQANDTIEGTLCVAPDGQLYNVMRYNIVKGEPGLVLVHKVNTQDPEAPLEFSHLMQMHCSAAKFMIKRDPVSGKYYSIICRLVDPKKLGGRSLLSLVSSEDMRNWSVVCDLIDGREEDPYYAGFQYCDFEFQGEDIIFLCRTAMNRPNNYHDSNYITFHRLSNFRTL